MELARLRLRHPCAFVGELWRSGRTSSSRRSHDRWKCRRAARDCAAAVSLANLFRLAVLNYWRKLYSNCLITTNEFRRMAEQGRQLANVMFDSERCSNEILVIYRHLLFNESRPPAFDSRNFLVSSQVPNLTNLDPSLKLADAVC